MPVQMLQAVTKYVSVLIPVQALELLLQILKNAYLLAEHHI